jgi:hypothetical protein
MTASQNSLARKPTLAPALHPEVCREGGRGRSRRTGRLRQTKGRLCEGTTLARLRPRAPRTRLRLTARTSPILAGRVRGARGLGSPPTNRCESHWDSLVTSEPLVWSRTSPGHAGNGRGAGAPPAEWPEKHLDSSRPPTPAGGPSTSVS